MSSCKIWCMPMKCNLICLLQELKTALHVAAECNNAVIATLLLDKGADMNALSHVCDETANTVHMLQQGRTCFLEFHIQTSFRVFGVSSVEHPLHPATHVLAFYVRWFLGFLLFPKKFHVGFLTWLHLQFYVSCLVHAQVNIPRFPYPVKDSKFDAFLSFLFHIWVTVVTRHSSLQLTLSLYRAKKAQYHATQLCDTRNPDDCDDL